MNPCSRNQSPGHRLNDGLKFWLRLYLCPFLLQAADLKQGCPCQEKVICGLCKKMLSHCKIILLLF